MTDYEFALEEAVAWMDEAGVFRRILVHMNPTPEAQGWRQRS
jgi:hypothetical protein